MNAEPAIKDPLPYVWDINDSGTGSLFSNNIQVEGIGSYQTGVFGSKMLSSLEFNNHLAHYYLIALRGSVRNQATTLDARKYIDSEIISDSREKLELERINRSNLQLAEKINFLSADNESIQSLIKLRTQDKSLNKILNTISRISQKQIIELTEDLSIYFTLSVSNKIVFVFRFF